MFTRSSFEKTAKNGSGSNGCENKPKLARGARQLLSSLPAPAHIIQFRAGGGAGIFRLQDGSLLTVSVTDGAICVDLTAAVGHLAATYQITSGTGRFKGATGTLTMTGTLNVVLSDASGNPKLLTNTGEFEGTVLGMAIREEGQNERQ